MSTACRSRAPAGRAARAAMRDAARISIRHVEPADAHVSTSRAVQGGAGCPVHCRRRDSFHSCAVAVLLAGRGRATSRAGPRPSTWPSAVGVVCADHHRSRARDRAFTARRPRTAGLRPLLQTREPEPAGRQCSSCHVDQRRSSASGDSCAPRCERRREVSASERRIVAVPRAHEARIGVTTPTLTFEGRNPHRTLLGHQNLVHTARGKLRNFPCAASERDTSRGSLGSSRWLTLGRTYDGAVFELLRAMYAEPERVVGGIACHPGTHTGGEEVQRFVEAELSCQLNMVPDAAAGSPCSRVRGLLDDEERLRHRRGRAHESAVFRRARPRVQPGDSASTMSRRTRRRLPRRDVCFGWTAATAAASSSKCYLLMIPACVVQERLHLEIRRQLRRPAATALRPSPTDPSAAFSVARGGEGGRRRRACGDCLRARGDGGGDARSGHMDATLEA